MKRRFTDEQIIGILKEHEAGFTVKELCRKHGMSDGNTPRKKWPSKVEFSRNLNGGDSDEKFALHRQSNYQHRETGRGWDTGSGVLP
jgi:hypothetical protein